MYLVGMLWSALEKGSFAFAGKVSEVREKNVNVAGKEASKQASRNISKN